jgi:sugar phosphate isomerase/epimerase
MNPPVSVVAPPKSGHAWPPNISIARMKSAMSRRDFLRAGAATAAASGITSVNIFGVAQSSAAHANQPAIRLGVASYSFRKFPRAQVIDFMKQLNTPFLNAKDVKDHLPMTPPEATQEAVAAYTAAGIQLTAAGTIYFPKDEDADIQQKFDYCKRAGISLIVAGPTHESLPRVEKFVKQYDIRLAIHNHGPEDKQWPSPLDILKAVDRMDPRVGLCIDVGHTVRSGTSVVEAIHKGGPRVLDIHMKDLADATSKESQVAVGDGMMPVPEIFSALREIGYKGCVDLEYEIHEDDPMPGMIKSFAYMRGVLAGMAHRGRS